MCALSDDQSAVLDREPIKLSIAKPRTKGFAEATGNRALAPRLRFRSGLLRNSVHDEGNLFPAG